MTFFNEILQNYTFWIAVAAWFVAQVLKIFFEFLRTRKVKMGLMLSSGGMPSSHAAISSAATTSIGLTTGFDTPLFALGAVITMVVMYDASGVRRAAGKHAKVINDLLAHIENSGVHLDKKLKEMLGHTPIEVLAGGVLGVVLALILT